MTSKAAVAGLPLGEGKAVILADEKEKDPTIRAARSMLLGASLRVSGGAISRRKTSEPTLKI